MRVEFLLGTGFANATHRELFDFPDDFTEDDIEDIYQEWANDLLDKSWYILEGNDNVD